MASVGTLLGRVIERKRAEMALRERETRLQAVLDTAADAIISIDRHGLIVDVNPATERMFGYTRDELISQNIRILMPPPHQEAHNHYLARYLRTREARIIGTGRELTPKRKDGSTFPVSLTVTELDRLGLYTGFIRDISQRKSLERQVVDAAAEEQRRIGQDIHDGIGQEAVTNAVRHANATKVRIELTEDEAALTLKVIDNGIGIGTTHKEGEGFGLRSMAYRAGLIGGTLSLRTGEQGGTQLVCTVLRDRTAAAESR